MIPPTWKKKTCVCCGKEDLDEFGFCTTCDIPSVFSREEKKAVSIKLSIARWTAKFPKDQRYRCMICGKKGFFPTIPNNLSTTDQLSVSLYKELDNYKIITNTYWIDNLPDSLSFTLLKEDLQTLYAVEQLPRHLLKLWNYTNSPLLCLGCILKHSSLNKKTEEKVEPELVFEPLPNDEEENKAKYIPILDLLDEKSEDHAHHMYNENCTPSVTTEISQDEEDSFNEVFSSTF